MERSACKIFSAASSITCVPSTCILTLSMCVCVCAWLFLMVPYCADIPLPSETPRSFVLENRGRNLRCSAHLDTFIAELQIK